MKVFDFKCAAGHTHEAFVKDATVLTVDCTDCGQAAQRQLSAPVSKLEGWSGAFPGAASKWESRRFEKIKQERKLLS